MRFHKLDLNLLTALDALLAEQNVSRAAQRLNLAQPTVSNALARLRDHYRDELLVMSGRRLRLTPLAESLRRPVADALETLRQIALARADFDPAVDERTITIASSDYIAEVLLAEVGRRVALLAPNVRLTLIPISPRTLDGLTNATIDLAVIPEMLSDPGINDIKLSLDRFVPVVWLGNRGFSETVPLAQYRAASHIVAEVGVTGGADVISTFLDDAEPCPKVSLRVPSFASAAQFVVGTLHMTTLPHALARRKVRELPLRILVPEFELPALNEMLRWPSRLDADPANIWLRAQIVTVARETFGPVDDALWTAATRRLANA